MTTQSSSTTATTAASANTQKSYSVRLISGQEEIVVTAWKAKAGWASVVYLYRTKAAKGQRRTGERGATGTHKDLAEAKAAVEKIAAALVKNGWVRPERKPFGFTRRSDSFDIGHLPKPSAKK